MKYHTIKLIELNHHYHWISYNRIFRYEFHPSDSDSCTPGNKLQKNLYFISLLS